MGHYTYHGESEVYKLDVIDDLKEVIKRYQFYQEECRRLWKDYEALEAENEHLKRELARHNGHRKFGRSKRWRRYSGLRSQRIFSMTKRSY